MGFSSPSSAYSGEAAGIALIKGQKVIFRSFSSQNGAIFRVFCDFF